MTVNGRRVPTFGDVIRFLTFAMVAGLFLVWLVFGTATVQKQNKDILAGVQAQLVENQTEIQDLIVTNTTGDRAIVCILRIVPEERTDKAINLCLKAAEDGADQLPKEGR